MGPDHTLLRKTSAADIKVTRPLAGLPPCILQINKPLFPNSVSTVSLQPLFIKHQQFAKLKILKQKYVERNKYGIHFTQAIERIQSMMVADWQVLVVRCRYLESTSHYSDLYSRETVTGQLVHLLVLHDTILTYLESHQDSIDLQQFESDFLALIEALYDRSKSHVMLKKLVPSLNSKLQQDRWLELRATLEGDICYTIIIEDWVVTRAKDLLDPSAIVIECDEGMNTDVTNLGLSILSTESLP